MTKLNITNKRIYKLKKHKNQSKKNVPKKRKNKKRGRLGRSFRKRRRKYNIKNNSIKNYKRQKGGVKTDTKIISVKGEETENVFKSEQLQALEKKLGDVQIKIGELNAKIPTIEGKRKARREKLDATNALIEQLQRLRNDLTTDDDAIRRKIEEINKLYEETGDLTKDIKELSEMQIKSIELNFNLEEGGPHFDEAKRLLKGAKAAKIIYDKQQKKAAGDKKRLEEQMGKRNAWIIQINKEIPEITKNIGTNNATIQEKKATLQATKTKMNEKKSKGEVSEARTINKEVKSLERDITKLENNNKKLNKNKETKEDELKQHQAEDKKENAKLKLLTENKEKNDYTLKLQEGLEILKTMVPFNDKKWMEEFEIGENVKNEIDFKYIETLKYAVRKYKKEETYDKKELKDVTPEKIEAKKKEIADTTNKSLKEIEDVKQEIVTETAKKDNLKKEIEALTKKEDEKLKDEEYKIAKGLKTGKIEGLEENIRNTEDVVKTIHEETEKAAKDAEKKKKKADSAIFYKDTKRKVADDAQRNVEEMEKQEKKAEESLLAKKHWKTGLKGVGSILHSEIKSSLIVPHVHDNDIQTRWRMIYNDTDGKTDKQIDGEDIKDKFKKFLKDSTDSFNVLIDQPYIYNPEGPYARTTDDKQSNTKGNKAIFYNYYLKKTIKSSDGKELSLIKMISQRMARYLNYVMGHNGTDDEKKSHKETIAFLNKQIQKLFKPNHLSIPIGKKTSNFRDYLNEKMNAIKFLEKLLKQTVQSFPQGDLQRYTDLMETSIDGQPLFDIFCSYLGKCYDMDITLKLQQLATNAQIINPNEEEVIKKGLSGINLGNNKPCEPPVDDYGELYLRVGKGLELYSKEVLDGEEEEKRKVVEALKKYEENAKETEEIQKQTTDLLQDLQGKIKKIKNEKYFIDGLKEDLDKLKRKTHSLNVVAKEQEMKNNTEGRAKLAAATDLLNQKKLESAAELQKHQAAQKEKDQEIENLLKREEELKAQMESQQEAVNKCGDDSVEEKRQLQEALDKKAEELAQAKAATEAAKQDKTSIDDALTETEKTVADQEAESEDLSRKEERLNDARKELLAVDKDKENKEDDKDSDEEDDEFDFGIIDEMANRPDKDVEIDFGGNTTVVFMARLDKDGNVQIEQRNIGKGTGIEKEISDYGMGNFESTDK